MFNRHESREARPPDPIPFTSPVVPLRACCCPARPVVKVIMPPSQDRPHQVDLWLCGHHYRESIGALQRAGAFVEDFTSSPDVLPAERAVAVV